MEQDLVKGSAGPVSYDLALSGGKFTISLASSVPAGVVANVSVSVDAKLFLDKLKAVIPGQLDDAIIGALEAAFLS